MILYRLYNKADELLWVGVTRNWRNRHRQHRWNRVYGKTITHFRVKQFDRELDAREAESIAIATEHPKYNGTAGRTVCSRCGGELHWSKEGRRRRRRCKRQCRKLARKNLTLQKSES